MRNCIVLPVAVVVVLSAVAAACGSEESGTADSPNSPADAAADTATSPANDDGGGGGSGTTAPEDGYGGVSLFQTGNGNLSGFGYFLPKERVEQGENVFGTTVLQRSGACAVSETTRPADAGPIQGLVSPGTVTVTSSSLTDGPLVLTPNANNVVMSADSKALSTFYGSEFRVVAEGGTAVPAFDETVRAPARKLVLTKPVDPTKINRATDLAIEWAEADDSAVAILSLSSRDNRRTVSCEFSGAAKSGVVPASLLGELPAGEGYFSMQFRTSKQFTNAGYRAAIVVGFVERATNVVLE